MRSRAEKRHNDWKKAIRKRNITRTWCLKQEYYDNLHQYSKNKIHCSCPMCRRKTNNKKSFWGPTENWSMHDERRIEEMEDQLLDNEQNF